MSRKYGWEIELRQNVGNCVRYRTTPIDSKSSNACWRDRFPVLKPCERVSSTSTAPTSLLVSATPSSPTTTQRVLEIYYWCGRGCWEPSPPGYWRQRSQESFQSNSKDRRGI